MFQKLKKCTIIKKLIESPYDRVILSAMAGLGMNLTYAFYHGIMGIILQSIWLLLICAYYIILSVMRCSAILYDHWTKKNNSAFSERFLLRFVGGMLALLAVILAFSVYLSFRYDVAIQHQEIMMITIATYTFYKITMAIINAVKVHRQKSNLLIVIRNIGCADAAASLLTLQRSMLVSFEGMSVQNIRVMTALTGALVCSLTAAIGIYMTRKKEVQDGKI